MSRSRHLKVLFRSILATVCLWGCVSADDTDILASPTYYKKIGYFSKYTPVIYKAPIVLLRPSAPAYPSRVQLPTRPVYPGYPSVKPISYSQPGGYNSNQNVKPLPHRPAVQPVQHRPYGETLLRPVYPSASSLPASSGYAVANNPGSQLGSYNYGAQAVSSNTYQDESYSSALAGPYQQHGYVNIPAAKPSIPHNVPGSASHVPQAQQTYVNQGPSQPQAAHYVPKPESSPSQVPYPNTGSHTGLAHVLPPVAEPQNVQYASQAKPMQGPLVGRPSGEKPLEDELWKWPAYSVLGNNELEIEFPLVYREDFEHKKPVYRSYSIGNSYV